MDEGWHDGITFYLIIKKENFMAEINESCRNQLISKIVKEIEKAFHKEVDDLCDTYGGSADYCDVSRIWGLQEIAIQTVEKFKEETHKTNKTNNNNNAKTAVNSLTHYLITGKRS